MIRLNTSLFLDSPDEELLCGICMNVLYKPLETPCRHVFCKDCIYHSLREQSKCPLCRKECTRPMLKKVLPLVQNLLNKLMMKCKNYDNGCIVPIKMEYYPDHVQKCDYAMVKCKHEECSELMLRKDKKEHEISTCLFRTVLCERGCGLMLEKSKVITHDCVAALVSLVKDLKEEKASMQKDVYDLKTRLSVIQSEMVPLQPDFESEVSSVASSPFWVTTSDSSDSDTVSSANSEHFSIFSYHSDSEHAVDAAPGSPGLVTTRSNDISGTENLLYDGPVSDLPNVPNVGVSTEDSSLYNTSMQATGPNLEFTSSPLPAVGNKRATRPKIKITKRYRRQSGVVFVDTEEGSSASGNGSGNKMSFNTPVEALARSPKLFVLDDKDNDERSLPVVRNKKATRPKIKITKSYRQQTGVVYVDTEEDSSASGNGSGNKMSFNTPVDKDNNEGPSTSSLTTGKKHYHFCREKSMDTTTAAEIHGIGKSKGPGKSMGRSSLAVVEDSHDNETHSDDVTSTLEESWLSERPLTRSLARRCNRQVARDVIPNVKVPPSFTYLLDKYTVEDSSEDEMWLPPPQFIQMDLKLYLCYRFHFLQLT